MEEIAVRASSNPDITKTDDWIISILVGSLGSGSVEDLKRAGEELDKALSDHKGLLYFFDMFAEEEGE